MAIPCGPAEVLPKLSNTSLRFQDYRKRKKKAFEDTGKCFFVLSFIFSSSAENF